MSADGDSRPAVPNPFSPVAVARMDDSTAVTVLTEAFDTASGRLDAYLSTMVRPVDGDVIAIVGDYGTGKTHLGNHLLWRARQSGTDPSQSIHVTLTETGFLGVFRRVYQKVSFDGVRARVREFYADVVADHVRDNLPGDMTGDLEQRLRRRTVDPVEVVERLSLMESVLFRSVQKQLKAVTNNKDFGVAFSLLVRGGFNQLVDEWLSGRPLDPVLRDRGMTDQIDTDVAALEALGVLALLHSGTRRRFMVVLDELDKITATSTSLPEVMAPLKKLLQVFTASNALLVLIGLPDFLQALTQDVQERIGQVVSMSRMDAHHVRDFIELSQEQASGRRILEPFTDSAIDRMVRVCRGKPRDIIRMCHQSFRLATDERQMVSEELLWRVIRRQYPTTALEEINVVIRNVIESKGYHYQVRHFLGVPAESGGDFWVTIGSADAPCVVLVTGPVLTDQDVTELAQRVRVVREDSPNCERLLVIGGAAVEELQPRLAQLFPVGQPLVYEEYPDDTFAADFGAQLTAAARRQAQQSEKDPLTTVTVRLDEVNRQQSSIYSLVESLANQVDDVRMSSDRRLNAIRDELATLTDAIRGEVAPHVATHRIDDLPPEVERVFVGVLTILEQFLAWERHITDAFAIGTADPAAVEEGTGIFQFQVRRSDFLTAAGVAIVSHRVVTEFHKAIGMWYRDMAGNADQPLTESAQDRLDSVCRMYDAIIEFLPIQLAGLSSPAATGREHRQAEARDAAMRASLREALEGLGADVRAAALAGFPRDLD